ncbi:low molecular weight protein-tyrosine phosphatase [Cupriavidus metallidurans]|jgi:protein-tyrosine phosphatase|uniref:protein-tyrosine-phosphatase n=1 Tax=Cupriavidus metallidurans (strain ATCC 43123 / DSM 2839 / NBRC 102507 / CH34) TaxID=266264 RepID=Q1LPL8_CUPMC|nr:low molecular weight protein-tyrosine-phosphatase [Cupriavidus metallidurans]ABF07908.1 protein-tyrosine-phosphatase [Cupriavidus metallidurans CH34]AVA33192.1 low molecular weight phosphotyrosine protein phosphatase [Cupriavidus metallidurans]MDE4917395.1 low molecular weight phosphotyrosine protein phosphatase [Cupriavidus metallidurans]QGS27802.1 low molecular weight phosphotyrosine protein phosphatase [Cupriavidus metallidurans]
MKKYAILMCCMGNICRSPTAEGVLRAKLEAAGLADLVELDSAGTHDYHVGRAPDARSQRHALRRGYDLSALRARQVVVADFSRFDLVLAMDQANLSALHALHADAGADKLRLLMSFATQHNAEEVPDPYYGEGDGFERVLDYIEDACDGVIEMLRKRLT